MNDLAKPALLVLASTYPRWQGDPEPGFVHELCKRLATHFAVIALVPDAPNADASGVLDGVEVIRYRYAPRRLQTLVHNGGIVANLRAASWKWLLLPGFLIGQYLAARRILLSRKIDLIHAHWLLPQGLIARRLARLHKIPYVVTSHGGDLFGLRGKWPTRLKQKVARDCAAMTVVSSAMRDEAARIGLRPPRIDVLPMGVDLQNLFVPDGAIARKGHEILFVGRMVEKKGLRYLLEAAPTIFSRFPDANIRIAGFGPDEQRLREQARQLSIIDRVEFLGPVAQSGLPDLYRRAAVTVAPFVEAQSGDQEGLGLVVVEAAGCECPLVVSALPAVRDVIGDDAAELVQPRNPKQLAAAVSKILADPPSAYLRARRLRETLEAKFDWSEVASRHAQLIDSVIHAATPPLAYRSP